MGSTCVCPCGGWVWYHFGCVCETWLQYDRACCTGGAGSVSASTPVARVPKMGDAVARLFGFVLASRFLVPLSNQMFRRCPPARVYVCVCMHRR